MITAKRNQQVVDRMIKDWNLGPEKTSIYKADNPVYWGKMAKVWMIPEAEARRQLCANCEYFNNTPEMMAEMESIPINALDKDGGGRGWCEKFDFICHNLRTCQAWERKDFDSEEDTED